MKFAAVAQKDLLLGMGKHQLADRIFLCRAVGNNPVIRQSERGKEEEIRLHAGDHVGGKIAHRNGNTALGVPADAVGVHRALDQIGGGADVVGKNGNAVEFRNVLGEIRRGGGAVKKDRNAVPQKRRRLGGDFLFFGFLLLQSDVRHRRRVLAVA